MRLLKLNEPITFGSRGNINEFALLGWSLEENNPDMTWTSKLEASLKFNAPTTAAALHLEIEGAPFLVDGMISRQTVWVHLNGMYCGLFSATDFFEQRIPLRGNWLEPRGNVLTFTMPLANSPKSLGIGEDQRELGICVRSVSLTNT